MNVIFRLICQMFELKLFLNSFSPKGALKIRPNLETKSAFLCQKPKSMIYRFPFCKFKVKYFRLCVADGAIMAAQLLMQFSCCDGPASLHRMQILFWKKCCARNANIRRDTDYRVQSHAYTNL
jgi:hypothetical protein